MICFSLNMPISADVCRLEVPCQMLDVMSPLHECGSPPRGGRDGTGRPPGGAAALEASQLARRIESVGPHRGLVLRAVLPPQLPFCVPHSSQEECPCPTFPARHTRYIPFDLRGGG